tara:strand:+ start:530 stop:862 length:333 start_codon:yes stop_codon:yes gene_type:complete
MVKEISIKTKDDLTDSQINQVQSYFSQMPISEILSGLKFSKKRWDAKDAGTLKVGRKSIINDEIHSVTKEQAEWRLNNWKLMIKNYRKRGYSYPTISRIKKLLQQIKNKD